MPESRNTSPTRSVGRLKEHAENACAAPDDRLRRFPSMKQVVHSSDSAVNTRTAMSFVSSLVGFTLWAPRRRPRAGEVAADRTSQADDGREPEMFVLDRNGVIVTANAPVLRRLAALGPSPVSYPAVCAAFAPGLDASWVEAAMADLAAGRAHDLVWSSNSPRAR